MADLNGKLYKSGYSGLTHTDIAAFFSKTLSATEQSVVTNLIAEIEDFLCRACRRNFFLPDGTTDKYYEEMDAGQDKVYVTNGPIKEVLKITVNDVDWYVKGGGSNKLVLGTDFFVYEHKIIFETVPYSSIDDRRAMKIYYTIEPFWGAEVKLAIKRWVAEVFLAREYGGSAPKQFNVQGFSLALDENNLPSYLKSIIGSYRRVRV
jgi:hypothetical protein